MSQSLIFLHGIYDYDQQKVVLAGYVITLLHLRRIPECSFGFGNELYLIGFHLHLYDDGDLGSQVVRVQHRNISFYSPDLTKAGDPSLNGWCGQPDGISDLPLGSHIIILQNCKDLMVELI